MLARFAELMYNVFNSIQEALISVTLRSYADAAVGFVTSHWLLTTKEKQNDSL